MSSPPPPPPSAHPRVAETSVPSPSAPPPPLDAPSPSEMPVHRKIKLRIPPKPRRPQGSDAVADPGVAETLVPSPSAPPPPLDAPSPSRKIKIRIRPKLPQGSVAAAHRRRAETLAPPPSAVPTSSDTPPPSLSASPMSPPPRRNPRRAASSKARDQLTNTTAPHDEGQAEPLGPRSSRMRPAPPAVGGPSGQSITCKEGIGDASRKGTLDTGKLLAQLHMKSDYDWMIRKSCIEMKDRQDESHIQSIFTKCDKFWSDKVDQATESFVRTTKNKQWPEEVEKASLNFAESLKKIEKERLSFLISELSERFPSTAACLKKVALVSDQDMLLHEPPDPEFREKPERLTRILSKLKEDKLFDRCDLFKPDEAAESYLLAVHSPAHVKDVESIVKKSQKQRIVMARKHAGKTEGDIYYSEGSTKAALLAAGGSIKACTLVAEGMYRYSFALVRPPGHHAGASGPSGFCLFNNIAVGAAHLLAKYQMRKILILDWDVHHGNGTEEIFYEDNRVLVISLHRHGNFYPGTGDADNIGDGNGRGFNVNLCWRHGRIRDVDYITVWEHIVLPMVEEFGPDVILISAGFDAAEDDPLADCKMTPGGYATLLDKLTRFGPIVMVLEGGYNLDKLSDSVSACIKVLLGDQRCIDHEITSLPYDTTWKMVMETRQRFNPFCKAFKKDIPGEISSRSIPFKGTYDLECKGTR